MADNILSHERKHIRYKCSIHFASIAFYDSDLEFVPEVEFTRESARHLIVKRDTKATLPVGNQTDFLVDLYLNENLPDDLDSKFGHIIEGIISVPSGKLYFTSWVSEVDCEVRLKKGNCKFTICLGDFDDLFYCYTHCRIYFWKTKKQVTNDIKVLKQSSR